MPLIFLYLLDTVNYIPVPNDINVEGEGRGNRGIVHVRKDFLYIMKD